MVVRWSMKDYWQGQAKTEAFYFSGGVAHWTVPEGVSQVYLKLRGGNGGGLYTDGVPSGGYVAGWLAVDPGDVLSIRVAEDGHTSVGMGGAQGGYNGGGDGGDAISAGQFGGNGGGGATDVRLNGEAISDIVALAAGAGGNSGGGRHGGCGGADIGQTAETFDGHIDSHGGRGGTQTTGGAPGAVWITPAGTAGSTLHGGRGADNGPRHGSGGGGSGFEGGGGGGNSGNAQHGYQFGGGGGSNFVGGLDHTRSISNQRGVVNTSKSRIPVPTVEVVFTGVADFYTFEINPNDGGSPQIGKTMALLQNTGPNRMNLVQEGQTTVPTLSFSGVILEQEQYENLEYWFDRRVLIEMQDDLGRVFYGVFSKFAPKRTRRPNNPWYHTYDAEFTVTAYINASGQRVYGRVL